MAIPVARVHLAMEHAALPGLLPTPPKCMMISLQPHPAACILPSPAKSQANKPSRADSDERWDAHKIIRPASPASSSSSSSGQRSSPDSKSGYPGRASSCERWDSNKSPSSKSMMSSASSHQRRDSYKRPVNGGASAAERWDLHKKSRAVEVGGGNKEVDTTLRRHAIYTGPGFLASPEPCMLPVPAFMVRAR